MTWTLIQSVWGRLLVFWRQTSSLHGLSSFLWSETLQWLVELLFILQLYSNIGILHRRLAWSSVSQLQLKNSVKNVCWIVIANKIGLWRQNVLLAREPYVCFPASSPSASLLISLQKHLNREPCEKWEKSQSPELPSLLQKELLFTAAKASPKSSSFPRTILLGCWIHTWPSLVVSKCKFSNINVSLQPKKT